MFTRFPHLGLFALCCLLSACQPTNENTTTTTPPPTANNSLLDGQLLLEDTDQATFAASPGDSLQKLLIQQFCDESKGYRANTWLGLNKCSWAIEKYRLDHSSNLVQRHGDELHIILPDGAKRSFIHNKSENEALYYQFHRHLADQGLVCIEKIQENHCPQFLLIQQESGSEQVLEGQPFWSPEGTAFLLQSNDQDCRERLEHWSITTGKAQRDWVVDFPDKALQEVKWAAPDEWLLAEANQYHRLKWLGK